MSENADRHGVGLFGRCLAINDSIKNAQIPDPRDLDKQGNYLLSPPLSNKSPLPSNLWFTFATNSYISVGSNTFFSIRHSSSTVSVSLLSPAMKSSNLDVCWWSTNLSICKASMSFGLILLHHADVVSFKDEKTCLQGMAEPWIGRISMASLNNVGYFFWFSWNAHKSHYNTVNQIKDLPV